MRVTGGKYRGKLIESREEQNLRPTTSRIREAVFNILKHGRFMAHEDFVPDDNPDRLEGRRVVDIFCGTGALGIESLSYDASHVTFIDQSAATLTLARKNVMHIQEEKKATFIRSDSTMLPRAAWPCDLAFVDPPYGRNLAGAALKTLADGGWLKRGAVIVLEQGKRDELVEIKGYNLLDDRLYDRTRLVIYQYVGSDNEEMVE